MSMGVIANNLGDLLALLLLAAVVLSATLLRPLRLARLLTSVSLPRMRERRLRTSLTILGVALGVAMFLSALIVSRSIVRGVTQTIEALAGRTDLQIGSGGSGFDEKLLDAVRDVPGVYTLSPTLQQIVTLHTARGGRERLLMLGVDVVGSEDSYLRHYGSDGMAAIRRDTLSFLNSATNLILSEEVAKRLGLRLHDKVAVTGPRGTQDFEVWGFIDSQGVGRAYAGSVAVMYYPAMQVAFERGHNIDHADIAVLPGVKPETVARAIEAKLGPGLRVERPALRGERIDKMLRSVKASLMMATFIALIAGSFLVFNAISIAIVQRKRELGVLRALGMTQKQLLALLTLEGGVLGFLGSMSGVAIGIVISRNMLRITADTVNRIYVQQGVADVKLDAGLVALAVVLGVSTSIIAAWLAAQRVAGLRPVDAFRPSADPTPSSTHVAGLDRNDITGIALLLLSAALLQIPPIDNLPIGAMATFVTLTLMGRAFMPRLVSTVHAGLCLLDHRALGVAAALASNNLPRDASRTSSAAAGLMASVGLIVATATFIMSFVTSLHVWTTQTWSGDLFITSGEPMSGMSSRNTPMSSDMHSELAAIPGVQRLRPMRVVEGEFSGATVKIASTDIRMFLETAKVTLLEGTERELLHGLSAGKIGVSENFANLFKVHRGDTITLATKDGGRKFQIAAVLVDYTSDFGTIIMDRAAYISNWQDDRVDTFEVYVEPWTTPERVRRLIDERLGDTHDLFVLTNREFRAEFMDAVSQIMSLLNVLKLVMLLVAALGLLTTMQANVLDRVRELGVLRALGMLRAQARKMVMIEATFVGVVGTLAGVGIGLLCGYLLLRDVTQTALGWYLPFHFPAQALLQLVLVMLPLSAVAGYFPARQASQLVVTDALNYE